MYKQGSKKNIYEHDYYKAFHLEDNFYETRGLLEIKKFSKWCKNNNIKFFITFPNIMTHESYLKTSYKDYFNDLIKYFKINKIDVIGRPSDFFIQKNIFMIHIII
ncbi:hypothetical protein [Sulfurimonas sp.]|uniref:hypothetical protein n=1 Tax=Sulfurimonas sp. TaxID=2022749 RepID=UPI00260C7C64|nr:hypothetical protein [Sulfurimonas sp.]MCW8895342.1 hypothetical protein [Sulfurimonas sp.]